MIQLAYDPLETPLLKQARGESHRGWIAVDGLQHLLEQGVPQFELFTGRKAPRQLMRAGALKGYEELQISELRNRP
jgi:shikimate 5-dehydrogenase